MPCYAWQMLDISYQTHVDFGTKTFIFEIFVGFFNGCFNSSLCSWFVLIVSFEKTIVICCLKLEFLWVSLLTFRKLLVSITVIWKPRFCGINPSILPFISKAQCLRSSSSVPGINFVVGFLKFMDLYLDWVQNSLPNLFLLNLLEV